MSLKKIFVVLFSVLVLASGCSAKAPASKNASKHMLAMDTVMKKALGDSICDIIQNAKKIDIVSLPLMGDSVKTVTSKKVNAKSFELVKFIVTNPKNYLADTKVYGVFSPQIKMALTLKKATVNLKYDFGLGKWGVFDAADKEIAMFDLNSDDMLRFACMEFPANKFLWQLYSPKK